MKILPTPFHAVCKKPEHCLGPISQMIINRMGQACREPRHVPYWLVGTRWLNCYFSYRGDIIQPALRPRLHPAALARQPAYTATAISPRLTPMVALGWDSFAFATVRWRQLNRGTVNISFSVVPSFKNSSLMGHQFARTLWPDSSQATCLFPERTTEIRTDTMGLINVPGRWVRTSPRSKKSKRSFS